MRLCGAHNAPVRRVIFACGFFLLLAPSAGALSFVEASATGDLVFRASKIGESSLFIGLIAPPAKIWGPKSLIGLTCVDKKLLQTCVRLKRTKRGLVWTVRRPVRLMHHQPGAFVIAVRGAGLLEDVFVSGCGTVVLRGSGSYSADGAELVSYTATTGPVVVVLKPWGSRWLNVF